MSLRLRCAGTPAPLKGPVRVAACCWTAVPACTPPHARDYQLRQTHGGLVMHSLCRVACGIPPTALSTSSRWAGGARRGAVLCARVHSARRIAAGWLQPCTLLLLIIPAGRPTSCRAPCFLFRRSPAGLHGGRLARSAGQLHPSVHPDPGVQLGAIWMRSAAPAQPGVCHLQLRCSSAAWPSLVL